MEERANSRQNPLENEVSGKNAPQKVARGLASLFLRFERFIWDITGLGAWTLAALTLLGLAGWSEGLALSNWTALLLRWFGLGAWLIPVILMFSGKHLLDHPQQDSVRIRWSRLFILELSAIFGLVFLGLLSGTDLSRAEMGLDGGLVGWALSELVLIFLPSVIAIPLVAFISLFFLFIGLGGWEFLVRRANRPTIETWSGEPMHPAAEILRDSGVSVSPVTGQANNGIQLAPARRQKPSLEKEFRKHFRLDQQDEQSGTPRPRAEHLPPLDLLMDERAIRPDERHINLTAGLIEKTLAEFGIPARVVGFQVGPTVTQFAVEPGFVEKTGNAEEDAIRQKVRVSQITALQRDLALALSAQRLRIEAPVPGRAYVGIEVPNARSSLVRLRPLLETETFHKLESPLTIALGRDVSGKALVTDLAKMPHLLIAGTTGSGKSVCISAITACLVMNNTPEDLRLVMIDPKMVELVRFNGLPHLYGKVETELERILGVLRWTVAEMDRRYKLLEESHSRHIDSHNRKMSRRKDGEVLPRIVVLIDELADLMMTAPEQTEPALVRLAQLARATGIHLIVATQRPSTDVVTGLIKANFPARLSFSVASGVDSRVILDVPGAESLLGRGDMLFLPPDAPAPVRAQGVIITDQEIERILTFWQKESPDTLSEEPPWEGILEQQAVLGDRDDLVIKAIDLVKKSRRASTSLLQRRLKIGYPRAARLMDELEELGVVGPSQGGGKERDVLIPPDGDAEFATVE
jgi:S-DNA-T family DNA segregation ATPase FtsK/SpoIIIE